VRTIKRFVQSALNQGCVKITPRQYTQSHGLYFAQRRKSKTNIWKSTCTVSALNAKLKKKMRITKNTKRLREESRRTVQEGTDGESQQVAEDGIWAKKENQTEAAGHFATRDRTTLCQQNLHNFLSKYRVIKSKQIELGGASGT
jgi:hypothetical protein